MATSIFINLPVKDLEKSKAFAQALGGCVQPVVGAQCVQHLDPQAAPPGGDQAPVILVVTRADGGVLTPEDLAAGDASGQRVGAAPLAVSQDGRAALAAAPAQRALQGGLEVDVARLVAGGAGIGDVAGDQPHARPAQLQGGGVDAEQAGIAGEVAHALASGLGAGGTAQAPCQMGKGANLRAQAAVLDSLQAQIADNTADATRADRDNGAASSDVNAATAELPALTTERQLARANTLVGGSGNVNYYDAVNPYERLTPIAPDTSSQSSYATITKPLPVPPGA